MGNDVSILTNSLKAFLDVFLSGYGRIHGDALRLLHLLALIDIGLVGLYWLWQREEGYFGLLAQKTLAYGFWIWLVQEWSTLLPLVMNGFVYLGLRAGGSTVTIAEFTDPSALMRVGLLATEPIWAHLRNYGWTASFHLIDMAISGILGLCILFCFAWLAIEMFVFLLQFYIFAVLASALIPFGVNRYTSWIADGCFSTIFAYGLKVMVLAFITSATIPVLIVLQLPADPTWGQMFVLLIAVGAIVGLSWLVPKYAVSTFTTGPTLTAGVFAATMVGGAVVAGATGRLLSPLGRSTTHHPGATMPPERSSLNGQRRAATP